MKQHRMGESPPAISTISRRWPEAMPYSFWLKATGLLLLAGLLSLAPSAHASNRGVPDATSQGFSFTDTRGGQVRLKDMRGKWVLVNFWAPWCPLCRMEVPHLNNIDKSRDIEVVGIAMDYGTDTESTLEVAKSMSYTNVLGGNHFDPTNASSQVGPVHFYPVSYLYSPSGEQVARLTGLVSETRLRRAIEEIRAGQ